MDVVRLAGSATFTFEIASDVDAKPLLAELGARVNATPIKVNRSAAIRTWNTQGEPDDHSVRLTTV